MTSTQSVTSEIDALLADLVAEIVESKRQTKPWTDHTTKLNAILEHHMEECDLEVFECEAGTARIGSRKGNVDWEQLIKDTRQAVKMSLDFLATNKWCPHCGHLEDAEEEVMPHTNSCFWPLLMEAAALHSDDYRKPVSTVFTVEARRKRFPESDLTEQLAQSIEAVQG